MTKYLIVGLGNIGAQYAGTRHNIGFEVVDYLASKNNLQWSTDRLVEKTEYKLKGKLLILIKPTTYMNLSGKAVKYWLDKENIAIENMLVIVDELALPIDVFRLKSNGSDGGHNGLKDIQFMLQTTQYPRLRFGIGNNYPKGMQADFVLGRWDNKEVPLILKKIEHSGTIVEKFVLEGIDRTMNYCNQLKVSTE
jgi:peptidyl-tRNA hydrolase, PTH1 family